MRFGAARCAAMVALRAHVMVLVAPVRLAARSRRGGEAQIARLRDGCLGERGADHGEEGVL